MPTVARRPVALAPVPAAPRKPSSMPVSREARASFPLLEEERDFPQGDTGTYGKF